MKNLLTFLCLLSIISRQQSNAQATTPYNASYICVNGAGSIWAFGEGGSHGKGLYYDFNGWQFVEFDLNEGVIAASSNYGEIHIVNNKGEIKEWNTNNRRWFNYPGISGVKDVFISKSNANDKFALGTVSQNGSTKYGLWMVSNISTSAASWREIWTDGHGASLIKAANDVNGNIYGVTSSGRLIAKYTNGTLNFIETGGRFVIDALIGEDGALYMMERGGGIYKYNNSNGAWIQSRLSATSFGVDSKGNVYGVVNGDIQAIKNGTWAKITVENPNRMDGNGNTPLTAALSLNNSTQARNAISQGANVNLANRNGDYPIHIAVKSNDVSMVNLMVNSKANMNVKDNAGHTPLYYAVSSGNLPLTQSVLSSGSVDPNIEDVVTHAVQARNVEMVVLLAGYKANLSPGLIKAAEINDAQMFRTLVENGGKMADNKPLEMAVDRNNMQIVEICLNNGADKKAAIEYAIQKSNRQVINLCLQNGAPAEPVVDYGFKQNDEALVRDLIVNHGVSASSVMEKAVPGKSGGGGTVNMNMARVALQNGAQADPYFGYAISSNNMALTDVLLMNGGTPKKLLEEAVNANNTRYASHAFDNGASASANSGLFLKSVENNNLEMTKLFIDRGGNVGDSRLIKTAVTNENIEMTQLLIDNGASVADKSLIQTAVSKSNMQMSQTLITAGAPTNDPALIQTAVTNSDVKITRLLLANGASAADPNLILTAVSKSNFAMTELLISNGAPVSNPKLIQTSVDNSNIEITTILLSNGASAKDPNLIKTAVDKSNHPITKLLLENGASPENAGLMVTAVNNSNQAIVRELLNFGADANPGLQPAVSKDLTDISLMLLEAGAVVNSPDLVKASSTNGNLIITKALVERGANPDDGALSSINGGHESVFNYLMDQGANPTTPSYIEAAVRRNQLNMFKRLVDNGAPIPYNGPNGENFLHIAVTNDNYEMSRILIEKGANVNDKNNAGETPLHLVVTDSRNNLDLCILLVDNGADVNAETNEGKSVLKLAKGKKVKDYLKEKGATK